MIVGNSRRWILFRCRHIRYRCIKYGEVQKRRYHRRPMYSGYLAIWNGNLDRECYVATPPSQGLHDTHLRSRHNYIRLKFGQFWIILKIWGGEEMLVAEMRRAQNNIDLAPPCGRHFCAWRPILGRLILSTSQHRRRYMIVEASLYYAHCWFNIVIRQGGIIRGWVIFRGVQYIRGQKTPR